MYRKMGWILAHGLFAATVAIAATRVMGGGKTPVAAAPDLQELTERQRRLEAQLASIERSLGRSGAEVGARLAAVIAQPASPAAEAARDYEADEPRHEALAREIERRHFDHLDSLARAPGGDSARSQLERNVAMLLALPKEKGGGKIDAVDCGETVCRVEMRVRRLPGKSGLNVVADQLAQDMGDAMSVRPLPDGRSVLYLSTPGHQLPPMND
jgi:hypothetical protein